MYFTDRGIEELADRRGEERVTLAWLADALRAFVDDHPEFETAIDRLGSWLARHDEDDDADGDAGWDNGDRDHRDPHEEIDL